MSDRREGFLVRWRDSRMVRYSASVRDKSKATSRRMSCTSASMSDCFRMFIAVVSFPRSVRLIFTFQ